MISPESRVLSSFEVTEDGFVQPARAKAKVISISIRRTERRHSEIDNPKVDMGGYQEQIVGSFAEADALIREMAVTAPSEGSGFDRVDFWVEWEEGFVYEGTFDMRRHDMGYTSHLQRQIRSFLRFLAGDYRPADMRVDEYDALVASCPDDKSLARVMLESIDLI